MPSHSKPHIVSVIVHCCDFYFHWMSNQAAGFPVGYATAAPAYTPSMYPGANPAFPTGMEIPIFVIFECHLVLMLPIICFVFIIMPKTVICIPTGYAPGTPFKMSCSPTTGAVPPYSSSPNPYPTAVYPVRSPYQQQNPYAQVSS